MVLNPNPEETMLAKKKCVYCGRVQVVVRVDWKHRADYKCGVCKSLGEEESKAQLRMVQSGGVTERTKIVPRNQRGINREK